MCYQVFLIVTTLNKVDGLQLPRVVLISLTLDVNLHGFSCNAHIKSMIIVLLGHTCLDCLFYGYSVPEVTPFKAVR